MLNQEHYAQRRKQKIPFSSNGRKNRQTHTESGRAKGTAQLTAVQVKHPPPPPQRFHIQDNSSSQLQTGSHHPSHRKGPESAVWAGPRLAPAGPKRASHIQVQPGTADFILQDAVNSSLIHEPFGLGFAQFPKSHFRSIIKEKRFKI